MPKLSDGYGNSPSLLRVQLTDGHSSCNAIQWGKWKCVSQDTPPGTKLFLKPGKIKIQNCFLVLSENQFAILGGVVDALVEKWELNRSLACHIRATTETEGGPPPWIPFGQYIDTNSLRPLRGNFRSLEQNQKEGKENEAFEQQRNATIAEIARAKEGKRKVFGGGKQIQEAEGSNKQISTYFRNGYVEMPSQPTHQTPVKNQSNNRWENKNTASSKQDQNFKKWEKTGQQSDNRPSGGSTLFDFLQSQITLPAESTNLNDAAVTPPVSLADAETNWAKDGQLLIQGKEKEDKYVRNRQGKFQDYRNNHGNTTNHSYKEIETYRPRGEGTNNQRYNNKIDDCQSKNRIKNYRDNDKSKYRNNETNFEGKTNCRHPDVRNVKQNKTKPIYDNTNKWQAEERKSKSTSFDEKPSQSSTLGPYKESERLVAVKEGDKVLAKYWEDNKYYPAVIHALSSSGTTCVVLFTDYGNYEEVLMEDIQQLNSHQDPAYLSGDSLSNAEYQNDLSRQNFVGTLEFRRGRNKPYINMDMNNPTFRGDRKGDGNSRPTRQLYQPPAQRRHVGP